MKPSDLEIQQIPLEQANNRLNSNPTSVSSQRLRSFSQNNLVNHEVRANDSYDLKKQVLAPEEIRKMLEKRMEERNRILSIKKSENFETGDIKKGY